MDSKSETTRKRVRLDPEANPDESKRGRVDSGELIGSAEARLLQEDLLDIVDESDSVQGLDSVIKSFEEEIKSPEIVTSDSGESQPQLGYLLEASDDELGLPPTASADAGERELRAADFENGAALDVDHGASLFEEGIPSYDSFEFGIGIGIGTELSCPGGDLGSDYVALGGLFDGWDGAYENDVVSWRTESLPAL